MQINEIKTVFNDGIGYVDAKIILDSINEYGNRVTTFELTLPRIILAELNTHRLFSRNTASSRAVRFDRLVKRIETTPYFPISWGSNKAGMVAGEVLSDDTIDKCKKIWSLALQSMISFSTELDLLNLHKQHKSRLLEPFLYVTTIVTATEWDNFFKLRLANDAQPEIRLLAEKIKKSMDESNPTLLGHDEWHLPFITDKEKQEFDTNYLAFASAMRCARVSYLNHDKSEPDIHTDVVGGKNLRTDGHCFIEGTKILTKFGFIDFSEISFDTEVANVDINTLEFISWEKPINIFSRRVNTDEKLYHYPSIDLTVTDKHTMIGSIVSSEKDRTVYFNSTYKPSDINSKYCKYKTKGESMALLPKKCNFNFNENDDYELGKLIGFYIGDGFNYGSSFSFRLVKERKIKYLEDIFSKLNISFEKKMCDKKTIANNSVYQFNFEHELNLSFLCGENARNKKIPNLCLDNLTMLRGVFDGLKNSDGSLTKNTWDYSTTSKILREQMIAFSKIVGLSIVGIKTVQSDKNIDRYFVRCDTYEYHTINNNRNNSRVSIIENSTKKVYCVEVPNHAIIIQTPSGKSVISGNCSPLEHPCTPMNLNKGGFNSGQTHIDKNGDMWSGNFKGWNQFRHLL